tara:strand:+ start:501 stop:1370 length:870 start_codon:yes stop_codon:yes gene_type:complete
MSKKKNFIIRTIAPDKFNDEYLTKKKNKKVLFVYDVDINIGDGEDAPNGNEFFKKYKNTFGLNFKKIKPDTSKKPKENKKLINDEIKKLLSKGAEFKSVVMSPDRIGRNLVENHTNSFLYLRAKLKKYESTISPVKYSVMSKYRTKKKSNISFKNNNKNNMSKNKYNAKKEEFAFERAKDYLRKGQELCEECKLLSEKELKQKYEHDRNGRYKNRVQKLKVSQQLCEQCLKSCEKVKKYSKNIKKDKNLIKAKYPLICRNDHTGESKASRLVKTLKTVRERQFELVNQL